MVSLFKKKGSASSGATRSRIYNCTVCTLVEGVPAGVNVRVCAPSEQAARTRARGIMDYLLEGTTLLGPGDYDLTDGESVRLYLDGSLVQNDCLVDREF